MKRYVHCQECDGDGEWETGEGDCITSHSCDACDGQGYVEDNDGWLFELGAKPYTPSRRRYTGIRNPYRDDWFGALRRARDEVAEMRTEGARYHWDVIRRQAITRRPYAGLTQADMLARATMCVTAGDRASAAWREELQ